MRDDRGFRTDAGQNQRHQAQGMEWEAHCAKRLKQESGCQRDACQGNAKRSRTGGRLGSGRVRLGSVIKRLGRIRRVERLGR